MFQVSKSEDGCVHLSGVCDSSTADELKEAMNSIRDSCTVDFSGLEYISSAGLGILLAAQKRLAPAGKKLRLVNLGETVKEIFLLARFDTIFEMENAAKK